jgi:hypothetical protein
MKELHKYCKAEWKDEGREQDRWKYVLTGLKFI